MDLKLFLCSRDIFLVLFSYVWASHRLWSHVTKGRWWLGDKEETSIKAILIIFLAFFLMVSQLFNCWLGDFIAGIILVETGMKRRKMSMEMMLQCCIDSSCCTGHFFFAELRPKRIHLEDMIFIFWQAATLLPIPIWMLAYAFVLNIFIYTLSYLNLDIFSLYVGPLKHPSNPLVPDSI